MSLANDNTVLTMPVEPAGSCNNGGFGGFGGDWGAWIILFLIFGMFGYGNGFGGGWGNNGGGAAVQGALTREQACIDNNFQNLMRETAGISDAVNVGFANLNSTICHQQYDTAMLVNGVNNNVMQGFHGVDNAVCAIGNLTQQGFNATQVAMMQGQNAIQTQLADCCCKNSTGQMQIQNAMERGFCQTNYNDATNTNAIIQNAHNDTDRVLARLDAMEMSRKDETIAALRERLNRADLAASQADQSAYLVNQLRPCPIPSYTVCNPFTGSYGGYAGYGNGYNNCGCGCNSSCGC